MSICFIYSLTSEIVWLKFTISFLRKIAYVEQRIIAPGRIILLLIFHESSVVTVRDL